MIFADLILAQVKILVHHPSPHGRVPGDVAVYLSVSHPRLGPTMPGFPFCVHLSESLNTGNPQSAETQKQQGVVAFAHAALMENGSYHVVILMIVLIVVNDTLGNPLIHHSFLFRKRQKGRSPDQLTDLCHHS